MLEHRSVTPLAEIDRPAAIAWKDTRIEPDVRIPSSIALGVGGSVLLAAAYGFASGPGTAAARLSKSMFLASGAGYLAVSLVDFAEHFRMERDVTGRYFASMVVPRGETRNHAATLATVIGMLALVRRFRGRPRTARDWFTIVAPAIYLGLGWRDEIVFHRRRARHREDILHAIAHVAGGAMIGALYLFRLAFAKK